VVRTRPDEVRFRWHGSEYLAVLPPEATLPAFVTVDGVTPAPPGDVIVVLRRRARWRDLIRAATPWQGVVTVTETRKGL
jgi:hypothetical protein